jgi:hypothetical protein
MIRERPRIEAVVREKNREQLALAIARHERDVSGATVH